MTFFKYFLYVLNIFQCIILIWCTISFGMTHLYKKFEELNPPRWPAGHTWTKFVVGGGLCWKAGTLGFFQDRSRRGTSQWIASSWLMIIISIWSNYTTLFTLKNHYESKPNRILGLCLGDTDCIPDRPPPFP